MTANSQRTTLATIASVAGVSVATVSKVVNGRPHVSPTTRAIVESLLDEHAYVGRRTDPVRFPSVELAFQGPLTAYSMEILQGVVNEGTDLSVDVVVTLRQQKSRGPATGSSQWMRQFAGRQAVIAVVSEMSAAEVAALARMRLPIVVIDPINMPRSRIVSVGSTNFTGGFTATQHLLDLGHRRIAYIGGTATAACNRARMHGYRSAMEAAGAPIAEAHVRNGRFRYVDGVTEGTALLALEQPPTAIFAANDETALGVLEAARTHGLRVPQDLSVVGFDDTDVARVAAPPLTQSQPLRGVPWRAYRVAIGRWRARRPTT